MKLGVFSFNTEYTLRADRLARAVEERGLESLWLPEHTHIPAPPDGVVKMVDGRELPREYRHMSDPFLGLAAAAAATTTLVLGTSICLVNQHHPISLAKRVATLDHLCDGRFIFGVGAGWNVAEMGNHGVAFDERWPQLTERLDALRVLWRDERARFSGKFVQFDDVWLYPKPLQRPHPPILLGTLDTPFGRGLVARHADAWMPISFRLDATRASIADVRARMRALGRDDAKLAVSVLFLAEREQDEGTLAATRELGVERAILRLPVASESEVLRTLDRYAAMRT
ncbi:MAG TPA: TIGR03619 family F420-dependent LLM class oxidoreductase [Myxococcota bacterium]|jgi:probable F420-dependent oxidoreductase